MRSVFALCLIIMPLGTACLPAQAPRDVTKLVELGPLAQYFELLNAELTPLAGTHGRVFFKLKAKEDGNTTTLFFSVGFFEEDSHLKSASGLEFQGTFPLKKGESVGAQSVYFGMDVPWHRIVIRGDGKAPPK